MISYSVGFLHVLVAICQLLTIADLSVAGVRPDKSTILDDYKATNRSKIMALFVFGDSTVDPGNNNYIATEAKSNFPPYGHDFVNNQPTGRFTDGRLVTDFIAEYTGVKNYIPPYLDPTLGLEELKTGVSFASAVTGYDPLTASIFNVLTMSEQLKYFKEYKLKMEKAIGKQELDHILEHSAFIISAGTNDFVVNYFLLPVQRHRYTVSEYQQYILGQQRGLIQELIREGARKIGVVGLPPMGCLPVAITVFSEDKFVKRECIDSLSSVARSYNQMLKADLSSMVHRTQGIKLLYTDIYSPLESILRNPKSFGFEEVSRGCCGTGILEASFLCNPESPLCSEISKYAFFDSVHPTEKTYRILFESTKALIDSVFFS